MKNKFDSFTKSSIVRIYKFLNIVATVSFYAFCLNFYNSEYNDHGVGKTRFSIFIMLYIVALCFVLRAYKAYDLGYSNVPMLIYSQSLAVVISGVALYVIFIVANSSFFTPIPLLLMIIAQILFDCIWSFFGNKLYFSLYNPKKAVVFYQNNLSLHRLEDAISKDRTFVAERFIEVDADEDPNYLVAQTEGFDFVIITGIPAHLRNDIIEYCLIKNIPCYAVPVIGDIIMRGAEHLDSFSIPVFSVSRAEPNFEYALVKRVVDVIVSLIGIILLSPIMIITALAVTLYDKGPALYKQVRLTKDGKEFKILKFRSMRVNAESDGVARLASDNDDRITPVGKIIRACRLDELPQLFNILKGDMTIVGPRPERPEIAAQYEEELPEFALRLQVKAGLTGLAQVYGRYNTEPYEKLQMDLMYINRMSVVQDLKLIFATIKILFIKESTQGTAEGQITASSKDKEKIS